MLHLYVRDPKCPPVIAAISTSAANQNATQRMSKSYFYAVVKLKHPPYTVNQDLRSMETMLVIFFRGQTQIAL